MSKSSRWSSHEACRTSRKSGSPEKDEDEDLELPVWAGILPFTTLPGEPEADPLLPDGIDPPSYLTDYRR